MRNRDFRFVAEPQITIVRNDSITSIDIQSMQAKGFHKHYELTGRPQKLNQLNEKRFENINHLSTVSGKNRRSPSYTNYERAPSRSKESNIEVRVNGGDY